MRLSTFLALVVAAAVAAALAPVERLVSDAARPPGGKAVVDGTVRQVAETPAWLYAWRSAVALSVAFFAALVATFFVEMNRRARLVLASLSLMLAVAHYLALALAFQPHGLPRMYPLLYVVEVEGVCNISTACQRYDSYQYYIDIGQILIIYAMYNLYKAGLFKELGLQLSHVLHRLLLRGK